MKSDLHIHTTASDGQLTPAEVVRKAYKLGLDVIAITDHDTVEGIEPALAEAQHFPKLLVIPGVELSGETPQSEVHVLGYFINYRHAGFIKRLEKLRKSRISRGEKMVSKLAEIGIYLNWNHILSLAGNASIGRPHIAQAMLESGYVTSIQEAFSKYIGRNGPAYVEREKLTPLEAVKLILEAEGLPVLAHPAEIKELDSLIPQLKQAGLVGLEVYYNGYSPQVVNWLNGLAQEYKLIPCGGSDYHGTNDNPGGEMGEVEVPQETVIQLLDLAKQHGNAEAQKLAHLSLPQR